jgi:hypothetical protein
MTIEDGYADALERGINQLPTKPQSETMPFAASREQLPFGPRMIPLEDDELYHINRITTCMPHIDSHSETVVSRTSTQNMSASEFVDCLSDLGSLRVISKDWFTLHQLGTSKVGRGITNLAQALEGPEPLFEETSSTLYSHGYGIYIAQLSGAMEYLVVRFELPKDQNEITNISLSFVLDGYPVSGQQYREIAAAFGFTDLRNAKRCELPSAEIRFETPIEPTSVEQIYKGPVDQSPWVGGLIVSNPFQEMPELADQLTWDGREDSTEVKSAKNSLESLQESNKLYGKLRHHHPGTDELEYHFKSISITYLTPLFDQQNIWNIVPEISW